MPCDSCNQNEHPPFHVVTTTTGPKRDVAVYCSKCLKLPAKEKHPKTRDLVNRYPGEVGIDIMDWSVMLSVPLDDFENMFKKRGSIQLAGGEIEIDWRIPF